MRTLAAKKGDEAMLAIFGKVQKELHISGRNRQDIQREEREEKAQQKRLADMDPLVRQLKQYREDAAHMRENNQMASVDTKLKSGEELTPEEQEYLKQNDPDAYREYQEIKQEREAYKRQLKSCRTKEDVEKLKLNKMGSFMAEAKKIGKAVEKGCGSGGRAHRFCKNCRVSESFHRGRIDRKSKRENEILRNRRSRI